LTRPPPSSTPFPYTTLFRSSIIQRHNQKQVCGGSLLDRAVCIADVQRRDVSERQGSGPDKDIIQGEPQLRMILVPSGAPGKQRRDRKSTRLNSSHVAISYAV